MGRAAGKEKGLTSSIVQMMSSSSSIAPLQIYVEAKNISHTCGGHTEVVEFFKAVNAVRTQQLSRQSDTVLTPYNFRLSQKPKCVVALSQD